MHANDNAHVIIETDLAGREHPVRAPLPERVHLCTFPGETLTDAEREEVERFLAHQRRRERAARGRRAA